MPYVTCFTISFKTIEQNEKDCKNNNPSNLIFPAQLIFRDELGEGGLNILPMYVQLII